MSVRRTYNSPQQTPFRATRVLGGVGRPQRGNAAYALIGPDGTNDGTKYRSALLGIGRFVDNVHDSLSTAGDTIYLEANDVFFSDSDDASNVRAVLETFKNQGPCPTQDNTYESQTIQFNKILLGITTRYATLQSSLKACKDKPDCPLVPQNNDEDIIQCLKNESAAKDALITDMSLKLDEYIKATTVNTATASGKFNELASNFSKQYTQEQTRRANATATRRQARATMKAEKQELRKNAQHDHEALLKMLVEFASSEDEATSLGTLTTQILLFKEEAAKFNDSKCPVQSVEPSQSDSTDAPSTSTEKAGSKAWCINHPEDKSCNATNTSIQSPISPL